MSKEDSVGGGKMKSIVCVRCVVFSMYSLIKSWICLYLYWVSHPFNEIRNGSFF